MKTITLGTMESLFSQLAATINLGFNEKSGEKNVPNQHAS